MRSLQSRLRRMPISRQLLLIVAFAVLAGSLGGFALVLGETTALLRAKEQERLQHLARIVADSSLAPLTFGDPAGAAERLAYLETVPGVVEAVLVDGRGTHFSAWARGGAAVPEGARYQIERELVLEGEVVGTVRLTATGETVEAEVEGYTRFIAAIVAGVVLFSLGVAWWLQRIVSAPIRDLAALSRDFSESGLYPDARALSTESSMEVRELHASFRAMFERIAAREREHDRAQVALLDARARLEQRVEERTRELRETNARLRVEVADHQTTQRRLQRILAEKEVLLREIHHRVKNNLHVVYSLLSLQADQCDEAAAAVLWDSRQRIQTMAIIHQTLYQSGDVSRVEADRFAEQLVADVRSVYVKQGGPDIRIDVELESFILSLEQAIPLGLILNELLTNALKYAFPGGRDGTVEVALRQIGEDGIQLEVADDGVGMPQTCEPGQSLGLQLVEALTRQLGGRIAREDGRGVRWRVEFQQQMP